MRQLGDMTSMGPSLSPHLQVGVGYALGLVMVAIKKTLNNVQSATLQLVIMSRGSFIINHNIRNVSPKGLHSDGPEEL